MEIQRNIEIGQEHLPQKELKHAQLQRKITYLPAGELEKLSKKDAWKMDQAKKYV